MDRQTLLLSGLGGLLGAGLLLWRWSRRRNWPDRNDNPYETEKFINEYMGFHYASPSEYLSFSFAFKDALDFPLRCAHLCKKHKSDAVVSRALDVGCSVGRSTFELAKCFDEVLGVDFSEAFIKRANELKLNGKGSYEMVVEGELCVNMEAVLDPDIDRKRVTFRVGDACNLPKDIGQFGMVLAANLICRLPDPIKFFDRLQDLVVPAGILIITSPYTWLSQYTPKDRWIGGYENEGVRVRGFEALKRILSPSFILLEEDNMPYVIRETIREHQSTVAHATVWMRKLD